MNEHDIHAVIGQLYLAVLEGRAQNAQLSELLRQTAEAQAGEVPENVTPFPTPEGQPQ